MKNLRNKIKNMKGITLISLIITIIVLLILAGVVINMTLGNDGIISKAQGAADLYKNAQEKEEYEIAKVTEMINGNRSITEDDMIELIKQYANPPGTVISYIGSSLPKGYLACDGTKYSASQYPKLFAVLKDLNHTGWKDANWTTEFTVPDLQGEFLRGTGTNSHSNQGSGDVVGRHQDGTELSSILALTGQKLYNFEFPFNSAGKDANGGDTYCLFNKSDSFIESGYRKGFMSVSANNPSFENNVNSAWYYTSRPTNTSVLYCIKY